MSVNIFDRFLAKTIFIPHGGMGRVGWPTGGAYDQGPFTGSRPKLFQRTRMFPRANGYGDINAAPARIIQYAAPLSIGPALTWDVNGDGRLEVIWADQGTPAIRCFRGSDAVELWNWPSPYGAFDVPTIYDIDGDHHPEILFVSGPTAPAHCNIVCLNFDGTFRWAYDTGTAGPPGINESSIVSVGDVNNDGQNEIVAYAYPAFRYYCLSVTGALLWHHNVNVFPIGGLPTGGTVLADIDGDGNLETFTTLDDAATGNYLQCLNAATGAVKWAFTTDNVFPYSIYPLQHSVYDVDGDGALELLLLNWNAPAGQVRCWCLNGAGGVKWTHNFAESNPFVYGRGFHGVPAFDIDNDGNVEVVIIATDAPALVSTIYCLRGTDGTTKWTHALPVGTGWFTDVNLVDIDGNGLYEIIVKRGLTIRCVNSDGTLKWHSILGAPFWNPYYCAFGDVNNDGKIEIITSGDSVHAIR